MRPSATGSTPSAWCTPSPSPCWAASCLPCSWYGRALPSDTAVQLWHFGISALTVGSLFSGALEIYGTTSRLTAVYWLAGGVCLLLSLLTMVFMPIRREETDAIVAANELTV